MSGSIAGSVESGGSAVRDICADVYEAVSGDRVLQTLTDANGMYTADDLPAGDYKVHFSDCVAPDDYAPEWNGGGRDKNLAPVVTVAAGATVQVNAELDPWGAITGSVEDVGGSEIRNICVRAFDQFGTGVGWSRTDANGMYTLKIRSLLGTAKYKVRFKDCVAPNEFAPEWNGNRHFPRWAPWVTVSLGHDTQLNAAMLRWGAITGIVTDQATALPIPDICIRVFKVFSRYAHRRPVGVGWARTRSDGTYEVLVRHVISWRGFKVRFSDCDLLRGYSTEWFDNFTTPWRTTRVVVSQGTTTSGIDAALARAGGGGGGGGSGGTPPPPPAGLIVGSFSPTVGPVGTAVTIHGSGFTGVTEVLFNGAAGSFAVNSDTQITADVPAGASAGIISVSTAAGTTRSVAVFAVDHDRRVNLRLGRSLFASGAVRVTDGFGMCRRRVTVAIQRHVSGGWRLVAQGATDAHGAYRIRMHDLVGRFRAVLRSVTLGTGDICGASASRPQPSG